MEVIFILFLFADERLGRPYWKVPKMTNFYQQFLLNILLRIFIQIANECQHVIDFISYLFYNKR